MLAGQGDLKHPVDWTTLGEGLDALVKRGVSPNIASFVGATTIREHEVGYVNRAAERGRIEAHAGARSRRRCAKARSAWAPR